MIVYWSLLIFCSLLAWMAEKYGRRVFLHGRVIAIRPEKKVAFMAIFLLVFFIGLRSGVADTGAYIRGFQSLPADALDNFFTAAGKDKGFTLLTYIFKFFIYDDYHLYLFTIAAFSAWAVGRTIYRFSPGYALSVFFFIASAQFTWLLNGMRQFIAAAAVFACFPLVLGKNRRRQAVFIAVALLASSFHASVLFALPLFFLANGKPFSIRNILIAVAFFAIASSIDSILNATEGLLETTQYAGYTELIAQTQGSNIFRLLTTVIPFVLCYINRRKIMQINSPMVNYCVNMSLYSIGMMALSTAAGGLFFGRMAIYFELFNLLLYPWIFKRLFAGSQKLVLRRAFVALFTIWFWYQMSVTWNLYYYSDILRISTFR